MRYDSNRHAYIDDETGDIIELEDGDEFVDVEQVRTDHLMAEQLSRNSTTVTSLNFSPQDPYGVVANSEIILHERLHQDDWTLARALQSMEFEMMEETVEGREAAERAEDFNEKEYRASHCRRQFLTVSTAICIIQITLLAVMIKQNGYASRHDNPMIGPPATTLVRFGAKEAALIVVRNEWWRLFTAIFLHAGILHLLSNVIIQLRVGGYLNLVFGTTRWLLIYLLSGWFGNMMSCIFIPGSVGVGSSGALLGMLSAWVVWIIFRWNKIPAQCHRQRNCQLFVVFASVAITLGMSFAPFIDWGAHFGGAVMGTLLAVIFLSHELDNLRTRLAVRVVCLALVVSFLIYSFYYMIVQLRPSTEYFPIWAQNDDFQGHHGA